MPRQATALVVPDLSLFARHLGRALSTRLTRDAAPPGHVELQNLLARAAGFRNLQALKGAPPEPVRPRMPLPLTDHARRALTQFDADGRLVRWPARLAIRRLVLWVLWTRFEAKRAYTEREVNAILRSAHVFGDHATLRRELVDHRLLARESDCSSYWKLPTRADDEVRALLTAWRARVAAGPPDIARQGRASAPADAGAADASATAADAMRPPPRQTSPS